MISVKEPEWKLLYTRVVLNILCCFMDLLLYRAGAWCVSDREEGDTEREAMAVVLLPMHCPCSPFSFHQSCLLV